MRKMRFVSSSDDKRSIGLREIKEEKESSDMFELLKKYDKQRAVLGASATGKDEEKKESGIVSGHAYTIVRIVEKGSFRLLQLRNPWGSFEWTGDWSDSSAMWDSHSSIKSTCRPVNDSADGLFWISWEDFQVHFHAIDICDRTIGIDELSIDLREEAGCCGPCKGCMYGCLCFWLGCHGCRFVCCSHTSKAKTADL